MSPSFFIASASAVIADWLITFDITLQRLKFPTNVWVLSIRIWFSFGRIYYIRETSKVKFFSVTEFTSYQFNMILHFFIRNF